MLTFVRRPFQKALAEGYGSVGLENGNIGYSTSFKDEKMRLPLLILSLLMFSTIGLAQDTINTSDYVRKGGKVFYNDSLFTGIAIEKAENGQVISEEQYQNGLAHGTWREWYDTGEKKFVGAYKNGVNDGVWTQWYRDGKVQRKLTFKNGQPVPNEEE